LPIALPHSAVDDERCAIGRRHAGTHDHRGAATVFRKRLGGARNCHDRTVGEVPDAAGVVAGNALTQVLIFGAARVGVGGEPCWTAKVSLPAFRIESRPPVVRTAKLPPSGPSARSGCPLLAGRNQPRSTDMSYPLGIS